jgi:hypothetical protein
MNRGLELRKSIFELDNRNAGEQGAEVLIYALCGVRKSAGPHDGVLIAQRREEVKSAKLLLPRKKPERRSFEQRAIRWPAVTTTRFGGNLNHIKPAEFDYLHYVAFMSDCVALFGMSVREMMAHADGLRFSQFQTGGVPANLDTQMPMTHRTLPYHQKYFLHSVITYDEIAKRHGDLFRAI